MVSPLGESVRFLSAEAKATFFGAAHPAFLLQEVAEDEAAEQALHEFTDGFVGLVLRGLVFVRGDAECSPRC